jgi:hypothetical protein
MAKRRLSICLLLVTLSAGAVTLRADSTPALQGGVFGIELCPQSVCGAAIFVAAFNGQIGNRPAAGTVTVAVTHDALPTLGGPPSAITGGVWSIQLLNGRKIAGRVTGGSLLQYASDLFLVAVDMEVDSGGSGTLSFNGVLSHRVFPPTISGTISQ